MTQRTWVWDLSFVEILKGAEMSGDVRKRDSVNGSSVWFLMFFVLMVGGRSLMRCYKGRTPLRVAFPGCGLDVL
jgi:hypothetical protein